MKTIEDAVRTLGGVWPTNSATSSEVLVFAGSVGWQAWTKDWAGKEFHDWYQVCTRTEFEQCAKKLRNEPSFDDHPDAKCFVQNSGGTWAKSTKTTKVNPLVTVWGTEGAIDGGWVPVQKGEVIGDWKDTLRLRPEEKKMDTTDTLLSSYRKALEKVLEDSKCGVVPKSHLEDIEELLGAEQMRNKRDWHKKGEFPPVGTVCRIKRAGKDFEEGTLMYLSEDILVWRYNTGDEVAFVSSSCSFQPLQTEREQLIEEALNTVKDPLSKEETIFQLADAGMLKMPEDK